MIRLHILFAFLLTIQMPNFAWAAEAAREANPALFKVADADTTVYILPGIAQLPPGFAWFDGAVKAAFESSDSILTEVSPDPQQVDAQMMLARITVAPKDQPLRYLLSSEQSAKLGAFLDKHRIPQKPYLDRLQPWYAGTTVGTLCMFGAKLGELSSPTADLVRMAREQNKQIEALETVDSQLARFSQIDRTTQVDMLMRNIERCESAPSEFLSLATKWASGDLAGLDREFRSDPVIAKVAPLLVGYRNVLWADWIAMRLKQPGIVLVTGSAGNFSGTDSTISELERRGFKVTRIQ